LISDAMARLNARVTRPHAPEREIGRRSWMVGFVALLVLPTVGACQGRMTAADLSELEWPEPDARIAYGESPLQFGYLRLPPGSGPHPVIVFIHGGCWLSAFDIRHAGLAEQAFSDAGYAVWSLEYRRVGDEGGGWPGTFGDIASGVDHLADLAREYPLDLDRVIVSGHSAGGQLALWVAARTRIPPTSELYTARPLPVHGVLALAPAPDLDALHGAGVCGGVVDRLMGGSPDAYPNRYDVGSPMRLMPVGVPQRLIVGAHDRAWAPVGQAYFDRARSVGDSPVTIREAPESGHFEMIVPNTSTWPLVIEELETLAIDVARGAGNG
jgi:acetyl esterase/lipase